MKTFATAVCAALALLLAAGEVRARTLVVNPSAPQAADSAPGTEAQPLRSIARAAALVEPGDVVQIHAGVYREAVVIARSGTPERPIRFEAAPGATVILSGADPVTNWTRSADGSCTVAWPHDFFQGDEHNPGGVEQVIVAGHLLRKVATAAELGEGTFAVDRSRRTLTWRAAATAEGAVEAAMRSMLWRVDGEHVHTRGLVFRFAANRAQQGMAKFFGTHNVVEDCTFEWANSTGADFLAADITVRRCVFQDNGQQGFKGNHAHRLHFDDCTVQRNNVKNFPRGWEAGGDKICVSRGVVLEHSRFLRNHGCGVWFDITNVDCTVRNCLIADNEDAGIFYEISYGLHAHDNVIVGNGLARNKASWGANGGICISSSPGCVIERNLLVGNLQGFCFREQNRTTPPLAALDQRERKKLPEVAVWVHDEVVRDNFIAHNLTAQVQGWFDIATERHWPRALQQTPPRAAGGTADDIAAPYQARKDGVPPNLSLEDLQLRFSGNYYTLQPGQPFFIWGTNWKQKQAFADLPSLTRTLGLEDDRSQIGPAPALELARRDFRLPPDHPALRAGAYPRGHVPDCLLGAGP